MNCCICGTVRNCGKYLDRIFRNMEQIGSLFDDYKIILYYDVSDDNTLQKLKEYQQKNNKLNFYVNSGKILPYRTHRLALGRNTCLDFIRNNCSDYPYFIVMDCDDICSYDMNLKLLRHYINDRNNWDSLSFQHPTGYYDIWALSKRPYVVSYTNFKTDQYHIRQKLMNELINNTQKDKLIPVMSAFNGIAIYRTEKFINCTYDGRFRLDYIPKELIVENIQNAGKIDFLQNKEDCEHRSFHFEAGLKNNARIRISPNCLFVR